MRRDSARRVREMLRKEWRQIFRDPRTKRIVFVSPILQLVLFGYAVNTDVHDTRLFVVDHDRTAEARALLDAFTAGGYFRIVGRSDRPADLLHALDAGDAVIGLEIPPGFAADVAAGRGARVQVLVDGTNSNTGTVAQGYATRIVREFALRANPDAARLLEAGVNLRTRAWYNPDLQSRVYNIPAVIGTILLMMSLLLTALAVVRERELGTLEQLLVSPLTPTELMIGKTLPVAAIALFDLALVMAVGLLWFRVPFEGSPLVLLAGSVVYIVGALGFGLLISTSSNTQQEAFMLMFLFFLPAAVLSGFMYPIETMPWIFQQITLLNPLRHFLELVRGIFLKGLGFTDLLPQFAFLTLTGIGAWTLAAWRFRVRVRA
jgi:ABC-2 type transport system permease protein